MNYVLDTNVISALRVRGREPRVEAWVATVPVTDLYVTALTMAEIEKGVTAKERTDPAQGETLRRWFEEYVLPAFEMRILPFDLTAARQLSKYRVPEHAPYDDALIAAITEANQMTLVTRNTKHFKPLGIDCIDPWS